MTEKETPILLDERIISNRGLVAWTPDPLYRRFWVQCALIRPPQLNFVNKKFNPDRSDYANIIFLRQGQVIREEVMNYESQTFIFEPDPTGYLAKALHCWFANVNAQLGAIAAAVGVTLVPGEPILCEPIEDQFDQILISVRVDGAIGVNLYGLRYDIACPEAEQEPQPPPPPPNFPRFPGGTPLRDTDAPASRPYDPPDDDGNTRPLPEDIAPFTPGRLRVTWSIGANGSVPGQPNVSEEFDVESDTYVAEMRDGIAPGTCSTVVGIANPAPQPQQTWAVAPGLPDLLLFVHNTCNFIAIVDQEYVDPPP